MPSEEIDKVPEDIPSTQGDVEMEETDNPVQTVEPENPEESSERAPSAQMNAPEDADAEADPVVEEEERKTFANHLKSPIVTLIVGKDEPAVLQAHQAFLVRSPYFEDICETFADDGSPREIELPDEDIGAVGCFLEFLYTDEYFPRKLPGQRSLETDPTVPAVDDSGIQLLKHARIYTLAQKWGVAALQTLSSSKIYCINSTVKGEIEYARYIYAHTAADDTTIRAPVANFWATRSHTLRSEAEEEFKSLCLEFPQFGFDILTRVLDDKLKRERNDKLHPSSGGVRKRARHASGGV
ncbi:hypothetical protein GGI43DRAFT_429804 [Trichoderma evansii]